MKIFREPIWRLSIANHLSSHANIYGDYLEAKHCRSLDLKWRRTKSIDLKLESKIDKHPNLRLILLEKWKYHLSNHANI